MDKRMIHLICDIEETLNKMSEEKPLCIGKSMKDAKGDIINAGVDYRHDCRNGNYNCDIGYTGK